MIIEFIDGYSIEIEKGKSFVIGDNLLSHKAKTVEETEMLITD